MHARWIGFGLGVWVALAALVGCDGPGESDAGPSDTGTMDAGEDAGFPPPDCAAAVTDELWTPPDGLPAFDADERGRVVRCGTDEALSAATVQERARRPYLLDAAEPDNYAGDDLTHGADVTRVLYRSERRDGTGAFSSGTLYLPSDGAADLPLLVHVSGTTGLGDECAPSRGRFTDLERTLYVLLGRGHAVFVPDLIGLGTPGALAYLEAAEAAHAVLDGARAALAIAPAGALDGQILLSGHSAGGHAALASQALQAGYASELNIIGVSAIAAVWFDTRVFGQLLTAPRWSTSGDDGWSVVYGSMYFIGHADAYDGSARAYEPMHPDRRDALMPVFENYCLAPDASGTDVRMALEAVAANVEETFDANLRGAFLNMTLCEAGLTERCTPLLVTWLERMDADRPPLDPTGAPIWFHQGTLDTRSTVDSMACPIAEARYEGVGTSACLYTDVAHGPISGEVAPWLSDWITALAAGGAAPACPDATPFPEPAPFECGLEPAPDAGISDAGVDAGVPMDAG